MSTKENKAKVRQIIFAKGKVEEDWINFDALGLLQQLGVVPAPGQTG